MYSRYLKVLLILLVIVFSLFIPGLLFIMNSGEMLSSKEIVDIQLKKKNELCIVGSGFHDNSNAYYKALFTKVKPKIVSIGSSRIMQFRSAFFDKPFITIGAMTNLERGMYFIDNVIQQSPPDIVIIGLDVWWFNENYISPDVNVIIDPSRYDINHRNLIYSTKEITSVYQWIREKKITLNEFFNGMIGRDSESSGIGVRGIYDRSGFGPDGSHYYTNIVTGQKHAEDPFFDETKERIEGGRNRFQYGEIVHNKHINLLKKILSTLHNKDIETIIIFPPFAEAVNNAMDMMGEKYQYIDDLKAKLKELGIYYYDFTNARLLGSDDCEFVDGFHGGDLTYAKILKYIYDKDPSIREYINISYLERVISNYKGIAFIPDARVTSLPEIDFLKLGCNKEIYRE